MSRKPSKSAIKVVEINSVSELVSYILQNDTDSQAAHNTVRPYITLFRGHRDASWSLQPSLGRLAHQGKDIRDLEKRMLDEFKRRALPHLGNTDGFSDWDWLGIAQHHGLPTRLLDWTESPLIALFFAFESSNNDADKRAVWMYQVPEKELSFTGNFDENSNLDVPNQEESPFSKRTTRVFEPRQINQRITSQKGWFTVHGRSDKNTLSSLDKIIRIKKCLIKFVFSDKNRIKILSDLSALGVNKYSIYPDLVGLSSSLACKYFGYDD